MSASSRTVEAAGGALLRYGLVAILLYFGAFKFTPTEARAIEPLVRNSPFMSWLYLVADVDGVSRLIGAAEVAIAGLIALRRWHPALSGVGSAAAIGMFLTTLSFLVTTPGLWMLADGYPAPSIAAAFLLKDLFLLGAAVWTAGEAWGV